MEKLVVLAVSPVFICLFYIFIRDKYEREPLWLALTGLFWGAAITAFIVFCEKFMEGFTPDNNKFEPFYTSFFVASLVEEGFKFVVLYFLIRRSSEFDEGYDAVVYSVFVSLGFAGVENFFYVFSPELGGIRTGILRAVLSVPAHGLFGVCMGFYFSRCRFFEEKSLKPFYAFIAGFIWHGMYDFLLLSDFMFSGILFLGFVVYMWISGYIKINKLIQSSPFNKDIF